LIEKWGRGTQKIVHLCVAAGHPEPEFSEQSNAFAICFWPSTFITPHQCTNDFTERQRLLLQELSVTLGSGGLTFGEIKAKFPDPPADRTLRDDFQHLKRLGLIMVRGRGRAARWNITFQLNKAE
jgi:ATP-dependent DNA helicase RecG